VSFDVGRHQGSAGRPPPIATEVINQAYAAPRPPAPQPMYPGSQPQLAYQPPPPTPPLPPPPQPPNPPPPHPCRHPRRHPRRHPNRHRMPRPLRWVLRRPGRRATPRIWPPRC
jgi:hypothetical protein